MSATLLAVVIAVLLGHTVGSVARLRRLDWFIAWNDWLGERRRREGRWGLLLVLLPPLVLVALVQFWLGSLLFGIPAFFFAVLVLLFSWGPRDLDRDVEAVIDAGDPVARRDALAMLRVDAPEGQAAPDTLVNAIFHAALRRWFGVLFWFLVLGPVGALAYRLLVVCADGPAQTGLAPGEQSLADTLLRAAEWPVAQVMTLGLALVGDFDRVLAAWRDWHSGPASMDAGFLYAAGRACVAIEAVDEPVEMLDVPATDFEPGVGALRSAMALAWRVLLLWLAVLALFVLAGFVN